MVDPVSRRTVLASAAAVAVPLAGCGTGDGTGPAAGTTAPPTDGGSPTAELGTTLVADGFTSPVGVVPLDGDRLLVADQPGQLILVDGGDTRTVLDLGDRVVDVSGYSERGLLGLALHPAAASNGRLFLRYSAPRRAGTPSSSSHTFVLAEFAIDPATGEVDADSERTILEIPQPQANHNAGDLAFGPDGYLYVPVGDGGGAGDQGGGHVEDWHDPVPGGNGQDVTENLLGSLLRIDVDATDGERPYGIPADNPLVGSEGLDEHFAWGLRNPWRLSFGPDGRCFAADVGQNRFEEINVVERGGNYGWNVREGTACYGAEECPTVTADGERLRPPVIEYGHGDADVSGIAVIGGYVYQGTALPDLRGAYVFGDWQAQGRLFVAEEVAEGRWPTGTLPITSGDPGPMLLTIGEDTDGELLLGTTRKSGVSGSTGAIHRVTSPE